MRYKKLLFLLLFLLAFNWIATGYSEVVKENFITMIVDKFDDEGAWALKFSRNRSKNWGQDNTKSYEESGSWIKWLSSSKYNAEDILPHTVFQRVSLRGNDKAILAIRANFAIGGYNWVVIEPTNIRLSTDKGSSKVVLASSGDKAIYKGEDFVDGRDPHFIWMPGNKLKEAYVSVWSNNYDYNLEAHFQDSSGRVLEIPVSSLRYKGWRNLKILIPYTRKSNYPLKFLRFKVNAEPNAEPTPVYLYFDYFHAVVDSYEEEFFGQELQYVGKYWGKETSQSKK